MDKNSNNKNLNFNDYLFGEDTSSPTIPPSPITLTKSLPTLPKDLDNSLALTHSSALKINIVEKKISSIPKQEETVIPKFPKLEVEQEIIPLPKKNDEVSTIAPVVADSLNNTEIPNDLMLLSPAEEEMNSILKQPEIENISTPLSTESSSVESYDSVKPVFPPFIQKVEPTIPKEVQPIIPLEPKKEEPIPEEVVNISKKDKLVKKRSLSKIILLPFFVVLLGVAAFFLYVNWDKVSNFVKDAIEFTKSEEITGIEKEDLTQSDLNTTIENFINGKFQVNDSGGFGYIYTKTLEGKSEESTGEISLGSGVSKTEDYSYFENGSLRFFDLGNNKRAVWDMNGNKYILFVEQKKYFAISSVSDPFYKNYAGQHILQDIVQSYKLNKNLFKKEGDNIWVWKWSLYSPVDYISKMNFDTKIYITNNEITKIEVYSPSGESLLGAFIFTYEPSSITEDMIIPKDFNRVPESTLISK